MSKGSGNLIFIKWGGSGDCVGLTDKSIDFEADMIAVTNQQSSGSWKEFVAGEKGATINFTGIYDKASAIGAISMIAQLITGSTTAIAFKIGEKTTGLIKYSGSGYVSNVKVNGPKNDASSYSGTITVTGPVTSGSAAW
jgi:TP901-1 family phage major tail protein